MIHRFQLLFITHYALFLITLCILMDACCFHICFNFMSIYQMFLPVLSMFLVILLLLFILLECILLLYLMKCRKAHCSFSSFTSIILEMMGLPVGKMSKLLLPDISYISIIIITHRFPITPSNSLLLPGMADLVMKASFSSFSIKMLLELFKYLFLNGRIVIISSDISLLSLACNDYLAYFIE